MLRTTRLLTHQTVRTIRTALTTVASAGLAVGVAVGVAGCSKGEGSASGSAPVAGKITANATANAGADSDRTTTGAGLPAGYSVAFDHANSKATDVSYSQKEPGRWEVTTGPAHILFSPGDTAANKYSVSATFEQLQAPSHPEAFGVFVGGSNLNSPAAKYTYFIVRGDGKYMVKVRDGASTRTVTDWTAHASVPKQDASGKGLYGIKVDVNGKTADVSVNGAPVATISGKGIPLNGITGVRINHNLHLIVTPISVIR
jgi:hypothetical protein